jgi:hypothetical protein
MTATITATRPISATGYRVEWQSDQPNPQFWIYQDGILANQTTQTSGTFSVEPGTHLVLEVFDNATEKPAHQLSGKMALFWYAVPDTEKYYIEELVDSTWIKRFTQFAGTQWTYHWKSRFLDDCQTHAFRIIPVGFNGVNGEPIQVAGYVIRYPDAPAPAVSYNATHHTLTLS